MRPRGAPPAALALLDDQLLDIQCSVDSQMLNTDHMLERFREILADGEVNEHDTEAVLDLFRHTRLEDHLNHESVTISCWARKSFNQIGGLISAYRTRLQTKEKAACGSGPEQHAHQG